MVISGRALSRQRVRAKPLAIIFRPAKSSDFLEPPRHERDADPVEARLDAADQRRDNRAPLLLIPKQVDRRALAGDAARAPQDDYRRQFRWLRELTMATMSTTKSADVLYAAGWSSS
jgi:hypothetical protein